MHLFADIDLVFKAILVILFLVVGVLNQLLGKKPPVQQPGLRPPNLPPQPNAANPPANVQNEIEEFLRRVAQQQQPEQSRPMPAAPRPVRRVARSSQAKAAAPPRRALVAEAMPVEVVQQPE